MWKSSKRGLAFARLIFFQKTKSFVEVMGIRDIWITVWVGLVSLEANLGYRSVVRWKPFANSIQIHSLQSLPSTSSTFGQCTEAPRQCFRSLFLKGAPIQRSLNFPTRSYFSVLQQISNQIPSRGANLLTRFIDSGLGGRCGDLSFIRRKLQRGIKSRLHFNFSIFSNAWIYPENHLVILRKIGMS